VVWEKSTLKILSEKEREANVCPVIGEQVISFRLFKANVLLMIKDSFTYEIQHPTKNAHLN